MSKSISEQAAWKTMDLVVTTVEQTFREFYSKDRGIAIDSTDVEEASDRFINQCNQNLNENMIKESKK